MLFKIVNIKKEYKIFGKEKLKAEFREFINEINNSVIINSDLPYIKSDKDTYYNLHKIIIDTKNKLLLDTTYYGDDKEILKHQDKLNKESKKYKKIKVLYMFDDKDNKYRNTLFKID